MKKLCLILLVFVFAQCSDDDTPACDTLATVRNLTGLDGCGYVFELEDGTRLEPIMPLFFCGTPPVSKEITEDPLYNFEFTEGKRVRISYTEMESPSICMAGPVVKINCIQEIELLIPNRTNYFFAAYI